MIIIPKSEVAEQAKLDTLFSIRKCSSEMATFEKKYNCTLKEFEKKRKKAGKEVFEEYDDYIDWKGTARMLDNLKKKLKEIQRGNFKVA